MQIETVTLLALIVEGILFILFILFIIYFVYVMRLVVKALKKYLKEDNKPQN
jgi:Na+-transporting methylmalonyl-CoA/oxaloacetate decarboxylase gamma subunit